MSENVKKPSFFARIARPFKDMRGELKKVVWPTKKQVFNNTLIVIGFSLVAAIIIGGIDTILTTIVNLLLNKL